MVVKCHKMRSRERC